MSPIEIVPITDKEEESDLWQNVIATYQMLLAMSFGVPSVLFFDSEKAAKDWMKKAKKQLRHLEEWNETLHD